MSKDDSNSTSINVGILVGAIGILLALVGVLVAIVAWLIPFQPIGPSPFAPEQTPEEIVSSRGEPSPTSVQSTNLVGECEALGDFEKGRINSQITIQGNNWVHADFWSPSKTLKEGYDEISVLFEPNTLMTISGVSGSAWAYSSECSRDYVLERIREHQMRRKDDNKNLITISVDELCTVVQCQ